VLKRIVIALLALLVLAALGLYAVGRGAFGRHEGPGEVTAVARPAGEVAARVSSLRSAAEGIGVVRPKQILFGDLHVHTTFSFDAFLISLPIGQGEGSHPPADACDFARYCSALDFWSINDHAEGITPRSWRETIESIRQCNDVAGDPRNPDTVAYLGWEWTQVGNTPDDHYGHKNVVLAHTEDDRIPARPIAALSTLERARRGMDFPTLGVGAFVLMAGHERYHDLAKFFAERADLGLCESGVDVHDLPRDCLEAAATPGELYRKLDEWGHDAIVIPHGTTWGMYTPPGSSWDKQLTREQHDPDRQTLIEVYSGHGNSEEYRDWRAVRFDADGNAVCPEPSPNYLPSCWRAGELIRERCAAEGEPAGECERRAAEARANAAAALTQVHLTVPGARSEDWLDSGQCRDCFIPAFNYRPASSVQYIMALTDFFLEKYTKEHSKQIKRISTPAIDMLMCYHWPGNVRELENAMERAILVCDGSVIHAHHLPPTLQTAEETGTVGKLSLEENVTSYEKDLIQDALKTTRGNLRKASLLLGATERIINYKVKKYAIDCSRFRK